MHHSGMTDNAESYAYVGTSYMKNSYIILSILLCLEKYSKKLKILNIYTYTSSNTDSARNSLLAKNY